MRKLTDSYNRVHNYLRISLTDKCNLNCLYCNPLNENQTPINSRSYLSNEELLRMIIMFIREFGFRKIRFTGGEPLVRKDIFNLLHSLQELKKFYSFETGITTNGTLLNGSLMKLKEYGMDKINISLDTLDRKKYKLITGRDNFDSVLEAIIKAGEMNFRSIKINVVIIRGINDNEIRDFVNFASDNNLNVRFIEFMPFGNNSWNENGFINADEMLRMVENEFELDEISGEEGSVAKNYSIRDRIGSVGFISSISDHFCNDCNRLRITADGKLKLCLFSVSKTDLNLREILSRENLSDNDLSLIIEKAIKEKPLSHPEVEELLRLDKNNMLKIGG